VPTENPIQPFSAQRNIATLSWDSEEKWAKSQFASHRKFRADHPDFKVLKYAPEIQDLQVADGWAIEWVYYEATLKMSAKDDPVSMRRKDLEC
jgi:hypothetical protein